MVTYKIDLDITPGGIPKIVHVKQYQTDATLEFKLHTRRGTLNIGNVTDCSIRGTKTDGNGYSASAEEFVVSTNTVRVKLASQMTAVAGRQPYEITITDSTGKMITATFYLDVQRSALDEDTISASDIREITNALDHTDEILAAFDAAQYDDAPTAGSNKAVKSGGIKLAIDAISDEISDEIDDEINTVNTRIDAVSDGLIPLIFKPGTWIDRNTGEEKTDANWTSTDFTKIPENGLYAFMPTGYNGYNYFYDSEKSPLSSFLVNQARFTEIEIPANAVYFRCSNTTVGLETLQIKNDYRLNDEDLNTRVSSLESSIAEIEEDSTYTKNALDSMSEGLLPLIFKPGTWIDGNTGEEKTDPNWTSTDFTEIPENGLYSYMPTGYNGYNFFYDSTKTPISKFFINQTRFTENEIPDGAVFFRCSNTTAGIGTLRIKNNSRIIDDNLDDRITSIENASLHNLKGFFMRGTTDANGEIVRTSRNMVTDILCSPFDTTFYVKPNSPINIYLVLFNPLGGAYVSDHVVISGNSYSVEAGTPFRIVLRNNDGTTVNFSSAADYLMCNYVPYETTAKLYFMGKTPESFPHENVTASGYFNLIETSTGKVIVNDASHQSNNAFIADFINNGRTHFDYFILSHWHDDHCGLIGEFVRLGRIDSSTVVFLPEDLHEDFLDVFTQEQGTWNFYSDYIVRLQNSGATLIYPTENSKYYVDGLVIEFWNTDHDKYYELEAVDKNYNDLSLCFYLTDGNIRVCYPGDLGPIGQLQCADTMKRCNIHEGQHHGWDNGVNNLKASYIDKLSPEVVVANDGSVHDTYYEQDVSPMVTWCIDNCVPFYRCYPQADGYVEFDITPDSWQVGNIVQRYRRTT